MRRNRPFQAAALLALALTSLSAAGAPRPGVDWPSFRGIAARGVGDGKPTPTTWSMTTGAGVKWKTPIAGLGHSSPIVWGDLVCVSTATSDGEAEPEGRPLRRHRAVVDDTTEKPGRCICLDKKTGRVDGGARAAPRRAGRQAPHEGHARELHARDRRRAHRRVPRIRRPARARHAAASRSGRRTSACWSPATSCFRPRSGDSRARRSSTTGASSCRPTSSRDPSSPRSTRRPATEIWRTRAGRRPDLEHADGVIRDRPAQVIVNGWRHIGGYDLKTGKELWKMKGGGDIPVPTPIVAPWADLHHERARPGVADLRHQADRDRRHLARGRYARRTSTSSGARTAKGPTCRRRSSTATTCTSAATTAS